MVDGVAVTVHVAVPPLPAAVHEGAENVTGPSLDHVTVPPGVTAVPASTSLTVAVQLAPVPTAVGEAHEIDVPVRRRGVSTVPAPPLELWSSSPP